MSTKSTWAVACVTVVGWALAACAPKAEPEYPGAAPAQPAAEPAPAYGPPGYPQPDYAQPPPDTTDGAAPPPPAQPPVKRQLETVEDASAALDQDELVLDQLLSGPVPAAQAGVHACQRVCAALGSMARSVNAICDLAGEDDARCTRSRQRLETNTRRVEGAGCSC